MVTHRTLAEHIISSWLVRSDYSMNSKDLAARLAGAIKAIKELEKGNE